MSWIDTSRTHLLLTPTMHDTFEPISPSVDSENKKTDKVEHKRKGSMCWN